MPLGLPIGQTGVSNFRGWAIDFQWQRRGNCDSVIIIAEQLVWAGDCEGDLLGVPAASRSPS